MPSYSKSVHSYTDVHQVFEAAGRLGFVRLEFDTSSQATVWAGRANAYRVLLRKQNEEAGREHACEFDHLIVRRPRGTFEVVVEPRGYGFSSAVGPNGETVSFNKQTISGTVPTPAEKTAAEKEAADFLAEFEAGRKNV